MPHRVERRLLRQKTRQAADANPRFGAFCEDLHFHHANLCHFCHKHTHTKPVSTVQALLDREAPFLTTGARSRYHCCQTKTEEEHTATQS